MNREYSVSPEGKKFPLPLQKDYALEFKRLKKEAEHEREKGREIVAVLGMGFVGSVMAAVIADSESRKGEPHKYVIGIQRPSIRSYWKIPELNNGLSPIKAEDPEVEAIIQRCVKEKKTLTVTFTYEALTLADIIVVDVQCDYNKEALGNVRSGQADIRALEESFEVIGKKMKPEALVLIETTVAPGTTEHVALPLLREAFKRRGIRTEPLLAHSYERVMPGKNYVSSIRNFWRVCSGINEESTTRVVNFLNEVLNTEKFPLTVLDRPVESETAKIIENSFRATILGFMDEWSLFSEKCGVDLLKVIEAIKVRPTHCNILFPGPGIGGYCLPKDGGLGMWGFKHIFKHEEDIFKFTPLAIDTNDMRALHVSNLTEEALAKMKRQIKGAEIVVLGASYKEDVADTRYSSSELIIRKLSEKGAKLRIHDPYVKHWWELEKQDSYPSPGKSLKRFFKNQDKLSNLTVASDIEKALKNTDAVIFAVRHEPYMKLSPEDVARMTGKPAAIIDCFGILDDDKIRCYLKLGYEVAGLGRGHIDRIKREIRR